tara:strand:- start:1686 stop:1931 length:246 start_codon:yes stop_codon:yes gene_type:complete
MIKELNPEAIFLDDAFDVAIVGIGNNVGGDYVAVYSHKDCLDIITSDGVEDIDAEMLLGVFKEHSQGKYSPVFLTEIWEIA